MNINQMISLLPEMAIFVHVAESESFSSTAKSLGVAPSSVSRSVTRLENALEQKLLHRTTRKMRLTHKGEEIYHICRDIMKSAKLVTNAVKSDNAKISGALKVAAPKALAKQVLMPAILDFMTLHPNVDFQLNVTDQPIDLIRDDIDLLIHITDTPIEAMVGKVLAECRLIMCASPAYITQYGEPLSPQHLLKHNCLCLGEDLKDRNWKLTSSSQTCSINVEGTFHVNHSEIRREAVLRGLGISIFPEFSIQQYIHSGEVVPLLSDWRISGNYQGEIIAQYPQSKYLPTQLTHFVKYLVEYFQRKNSEKNQP
ncbi:MULTISPECIES: LysR family transcriptional regulator [Vibrio]|uniref:Putative LysR family transcriptional regulator n=1 Tax=Vibrio halioticoli NBRC 102217 TaxID=1219072 RepID=V5FD31_9VIBR|nr:MULTISPECIES: LysR family transcriptional regulator [Vibrio]MPW35102.1 LysR family transcriptional regulator [Vibrio sp. B1Z05]GAD89458.1 putative LysR family transcriptional regulator [Vibrio halioticoli NBRC 102217]